VRRLAAALAVGALAMPATWSAPDVRVDDPAATFGGTPRGHREPVVAIDPADPNIVLVVTSDQNPQNQATEGDGYAAWVHLYRSTDGGVTFKDVRLFDWPDPTHTWDSGDPSLTFARDGTAYMTMLSDDLHVGHHRRIRSYHSSDGGLTWSAPSMAFQGVLDPTHMHCVSADKDLATYDEKTHELLLVFTRTTWDCGQFPDDEVVDLGAIPPSANIELVLTRSGDGGQTWATPVPIEPHNYAIGANPRVAADGTIYVGYSAAAPIGTALSCPSPLGTVGDLQPRELNEVVASSTDNGEHWAYARRPLCDAAVFGSERADETHRANPTGGESMGTMALDLSTGIAYAAWPTFGAQAPNLTFGIDVMTSSDRGAKWSAVTHLSDPTHDAVLPTLAASNGVAYLSWVSTNDGWDTYDVYVVTSTDGGADWSQPVKLSTVSGAGDGEIGDYNWLDATDDRVAVAWTLRRPGSPATDVYVRTAKVGEAVSPATTTAQPLPPTGGNFPVWIGGVLVAAALGVTVARRHTILTTTDRS
jgi:hypothetical protein